MSHLSAASSRRSQSRAFLTSPVLMLIDSPRPDWTRAASAMCGLHPPGARGATPRSC
jgi:hypothetical protein